MFSERLHLYGCPHTSVALTPGGRQRSTRRLQNKNIRGYLCHRVSEPESGKQSTWKAREHTITAQHLLTGSSRWPPLGPTQPRVCVKEAPPTREAPPTLQISPPPLPLPSPYRYTLEPYVILSLAVTCTHLKTSMLLRP